MIAAPLISDYWQQALARLIEHKIIVAAAALNAFSSFAVADILTDNRTYAFTLCALSTMATAYFTSRPRLIAAQAAREASQHVNQQHSQAELIKNLHYEIERKATELSVIRISKHNALNALQAAYWHIDELHEIFRHSIPQIEVPRFTKMSVKSIFGDEDEHLKAMIGDMMRRRASLDTAETTA